jgi:K+-transporting ATPase ATPase A chain
MATEYLAVVVTILFTIATSVALGRYMFKVFSGGRTFLDPVLVPIERVILRVIGVDASSEAEQQVGKGTPSRCLSRTPSCGS